MKNRTFLLQTLLLSVFMAVIFLVLQPVSADSGRISATTDGILLGNQSHKTIAGNGRGKRGQSRLAFHCRWKSALYDKVIVNVCGKANQYITYRLVVTGSGQYVLDASPYLCGNQGLAIGQTAPTYEISAPESIDTTNGASYRLINPLLPDNQKGNYQAGQTIEVTYYYEKILPEVQYTGTIIVHFIDDQGKRIEPSTSALTESCWFLNKPQAIRLGKVNGR